MSLNIHYEVRLMIFSFLTGAGLMMSYDVFRAFRILVMHHALWVGIEDMIYWIYASFITFNLLYQMNDGSLRAYVILAVFTGMVLYHNLISKFFLKLLKNITKYIRIRLRNLFGIKKG